MIFFLIFPRKIEFDNSIKIVLIPSEMVSSLKEKNLLPVGANSFLLEKIPYHRGLDVQNKKVVFLEK